MKNKISNGLRSISPLLLASLLTFGLVVVNLPAGFHVSTSPTVLGASAAAAVLGGNEAWCGVTVGAIGGVIALGLAGVTFGLGVAMGISATLHAVAILCIAT